MGGGGSPPPPRSCPALPRPATPTAHATPPASPHTGYLLALGPLLFISICDVWLQLFSRDQAYAINLAAVGTVAFGCTGRAGAGPPGAHRGPPHLPRLRAGGVPH